jgi:hypothetical protein
LTPGSFSLLLAACAVAITTAAALIYHLSVAVAIILGVFAAAIGAAELLFIGVLRPELFQLMFRDEDGPS